MLCGFTLPRHGYFYLWCSPQQFATSKSSRISLHLLLACFLWQVLPADACLLSGCLDVLLLHLCIMHVFSLSKTLFPHKCTPQMFYCTNMMRCTLMRIIPWCCTRTSLDRMTINFLCSFLFLLLVKKIWWNKPPSRNFLHFSPCVDVISPQHEVSPPSGSRIAPVTLPRFIVFFTSSCSYILLISSKKTLLGNSAEMNRKRIPLSSPRGNMHRWFWPSVLWRSLSATRRFGSLALIFLWF